MNTAALSIGHSDSGITEIILPRISATHTKSLVMPMLAYLSRQCDEKWFTWVAPEKVTKEELENFDFADQTIRLVHTKHDAMSLRVSWDALINGNSGTVVTSLSKFSEKERKELENAARLGGTRGIVLRYQ